MIVTSFLLMLPILVMGAGGFLLSKLYHVSRDSLVKVIVDFFMPMLIFHALCTSSIKGRMMAELAGVTTFVVAFLLVIALIYCRAAGLSRREFVPSIIFMNSGFLGIPLMKLWGGLTAMNTIVIYDQIQTLYIFTLGIMILTGGFTFRGLVEMMKSPILWAIIAGFICRLSGLSLPGPFLTTLEFGGEAAPPLAAFAMGVTLGETKFRLDLHLAAGVLLRFGAGFLAGFLGCRLFGITGLTRTVVIVASSLPSAVFVSVLPARYGVNSDFGAAMVAASTLLGVLVIPLIFLLAG